MAGRVKKLGRSCTRWGFPKFGGYLLGVFMIREAYYLGVYIGGPPIFVNPHVGSETEQEYGQNTEASLSPHAA